METIRCLVCQSQSIADSNVSMAGDMRSQIRQRILAGEKPEHVRKWLVERYGDWVSYAPPVEPLTWQLWAMPVLLLAAGLWQMRGRFKRKTHRSRGQGPEESRVGKKAVSTCRSRWWASHLKKSETSHYSRYKEL